MLDASAKEFNDFLRQYSLYIAIGIAAFILVVVLVVLFICLSKRKKADATPKRVIVASAYIEALGGADNIVSHSLVRSRIVLTLKDYDIVDKEKLKEAGVDGFIMMSDKLTLVIKGDAEKVNAAIFPEG
ncbi:MAG: PTS transporter subunit EIIB [Bacilli bacterium]|nr:PTS transporter subunit EIIB [Bacilli bacterium]